MAEVAPVRTELAQLGTYGSQDPGIRLLRKHLVQMMRQYRDLADENRRQQRLARDDRESTALSVLAGLDEAVSRIFGDALRDLDRAIDAAAPTSPAKPAPARNRSCNRHDDCDAADAAARAKGHLSAEHCHDECCEDCFGN